MALWRREIRDDRGQSVRVEFEIDPDVNEDLREFLPWRDRLVYGLVGFVVTMLLTFGMVGLAAGLVAVTAMPAHWAVPLAMAVEIPIAFVAMVQLNSRLWQTVLAPKIRAVGACAACLGDLEVVPPEDDGCTVCPECGAAWRLEGKEEK